MNGLYEGKPSGRFALLQGVHWHWETARNAAIVWKIGEQSAFSSNQSSSGSWLIASCEVVMMVVTLVAKGWSEIRQRRAKMVAAIG